MSVATAVAPTEDMTEYRVIPLSDLYPHPRNLRVDLGDLSGLVSSIRDGGVRQPLRVAPRDLGGYWIVAGHRRHAAAAEAGSRACPVSLTPASVLRPPTSPTCSWRTPNAKT